MKELVEIYGFSTGNIADIARQLEIRLGIQFTERYGDNMNGDYFSYSSNQPGEVEDLGLTLTRNEDPMGHALMCDFAPDCQLILNVTQTGETSKVDAAIASMSNQKGELLQRVLWSSDGPDDHQVLFERSGDS